VWRFILKRCLKCYIQSNQDTLGTPKKRPLFRAGRYSEVPPIKLVWIWDVWVSGWPLLTGGRYSEVVVSTGLTVHDYSKNKRNCMIECFFNTWNLSDNVSVEERSQNDSLFLSIPIKFVLLNWRLKNVTFETAPKNDFT
jgi:hypothetical protein